MAKAIIIMLSFSVFIITWIVWKRRTSASVFPLLVGMGAYILIALLRMIARGVVFTESLMATPLLFYIVSALLSGVFEEAGRFVVFRHTIIDSWVDCVSYGIGHVSIELILTYLPHIQEADISDIFLGGYSFATGISFSVAMSVLVYIAANYADSKKFLALAVAFHTLMDIIPAGYYLGTFNLGEYMLIEILGIAAVCYFSYRMYRHFSEY